MTRTILAAFALFALLAAPARLYAQHSSEQTGHAADQGAATASTQAHEHGALQSPVSTPDIDALVAKMNAATGAAKIDAVTDLLTALVQKHKDCEAKMAGMMKKMDSDPEKAAGPHVAR